MPDTLSKPETRTKPDARTKLDILYHDVLGEIDDVIKRVNSLQFETGKKLEAQTEAAEKRIVNLIGFLQKAGDAHQEQIEAYTNAQGNLVKTQMENDANTAKARFERDSSTAIRAALVEVKRTVENTVQGEIAEPMREMERFLKKSVWTNWALCLVCGVLGGMVVFSAIAFTHNSKQEQYAALGKAVSASWNKLDGKAKALINGEREE